MENKTINSIVGGIFGTLIGVGLFYLISAFFGNTWDDGPALIVYSPIFIPAIVGIVTGLVAEGLGSTFLSCLIAGILYPIIGVCVLIIGGLISEGPVGVVALIVILGLIFGGGTTVYFIIFK